MRRTMISLAIMATSACGGGGDGTTHPTTLAASQMAQNDGSSSGTSGATVSTPPSVAVRDPNNKFVAGVTVTFTVTSGGGTITGATQTTDASGIARVGSWMLGLGSGTNTLKATSPGLPDVIMTAQGSTFFASIEAGNAYSCALTTVGAAYCWGRNGGGALGDATTTDRASPVLVQGGLRFTDLSARFGHTCAVTSAGVAYCWGDNGFGGLGDGTTVSRAIPTLVLGGLTFTSISAGSGHTCALTSTGAAYCWGQNAAGELGDGTTTQRTAPVAVQGGLTFTSITAGRAENTCGVTTSGAAYCWGRGDYGELGTGIGVTDNQSRPTAVQGGLAFSSVSAGLQHACGRTTTGAGYCWGDNSLSADGDGTTLNRYAPTAVIGGLTFTSVSAGSYHSCALSGGAAYCWGDNRLNSQGALGDNTIDSHATPTAVAGGLTFTAISAGHEHSCALTSAGRVHCWGLNATGGLGDGTTTGRLAPVAVIQP